MKKKKTKWFKCTCGCGTFFPGNDGVFFMCSNCHKVYDEYGKYKAIKSSVEDIGELVNMSGTIGNSKQCQSD
jgi:hypothetical protein